MSAFILNAAKERVDINFSLATYKEAKEQGLTVEQLMNQQYGKDADLSIGTPFEQACATVGLVRPNSKQRAVFGDRSMVMHDIFEGKASAATNVEQKGDPFGSQARSLFPAFIIAQIENQMQPDRVTDAALFRKMAVTTVPVVGDTYLQPVLNYNNVNGANTTADGARAARISQGALAPTIMFLGTSEKSRNIPTYGIGVEMTDKALKNTTLDLFTLTVNRYFSIEQDARVYTYMANLFSGDLDQNSGAVPGVATVTLDSAGASGTVTHKAWVKFLARKRRYRQVTVCIADIDTYLKVENRTGRPASNSYDPTLARIDPQALVINNTFGSDVRWMITDAASDGGPVPANTVWAMDESQAFMFVKNTEADYTATESFVLRRTSSMVWHWSEEALRLWGDSELTAFDVLTIS